MVTALTVVVDPVDAAVRLPLDRHHAPRAADGPPRVGGGPRDRRVSGNYQTDRTVDFAINLLTLLVIAAGTDYAIFLLGRYQEARKPARTAKPLSTACTAEPRTWSWGRA